MFSNVDRYKVIKIIRINQNYFGLFFISLTERDGEPVVEVPFDFLVEVSVILGDAHGEDPEVTCAWVTHVLSDGLNDLITPIGFPCRVEPFPPVTVQSG